jgi:integrase
VLDHAIVKTLHKTTRAGLSVAVIPRNPRLDQVLDMLRSRQRSPGMTSLLVNHHGQSWRDYNLDIGFRLVRDTCGIGHLDARTGDYIPKTLHDLRRTYATRLMTRSHLSDEEVATILGWSVDYAAKIRWVYVDERTRVEAIGRRLANTTFHKDIKFYV